MKTGPKPKSSRELIVRYAERQSFTMVRMLNELEGQVKCTLCGTKRVVNRGSARVQRCRCQMVRKFQAYERTVTNTNEQLAELGWKDKYRCLKVGGHYATDKHLFKCLTCDHKFHAVASVFFTPTIQYPCVKCRQDAYDRFRYVTHEEFVKKLRSRNSNLRCSKVSQYVPSTVLVTDTECGHEFKLLTYKVTAPSKSRYNVRCTVCQPSACWHEFTVGGVAFKTRSLVERQFVELLVNEKGVDPSQIEYEPSNCEVKYRHPIYGDIRGYRPDFKIGSTLIEVKDRSSLGLQHYHWMPQEHALKENRAKFKAALAEFDDFRVFCFARGRFTRVRHLPSWRSLSGGASV